MSTNLPGNEPDTSAASSPGTGAGAGQPKNKPQKRSSLPAQNVEMSGTTDLSPAESTRPANLNQWKAQAKVLPDEFLAKVASAADWRSAATDYLHFRAAEGAKANRPTLYPDDPGNPRLASMLRNNAIAVHAKSSEGFRAALREHKLGDAQDTSDIFLDLFRDYCHSVKSYAEAHFPDDSKRKEIVGCMDQMIDKVGLSAYDKTALQLALPRAIITAGTLGMAALAMTYSLLNVSPWYLTLSAVRTELPALQSLKGRLDDPALTLGMVFETLGHQQAPWIGLGLLFASATFLDVRAKLRPEDLVAQQQADKAAHIVTQPWFLALAGGCLFVLFLAAHNTELIAERATAVKKWFKPDGQFVPPDPADDSEAARTQREHIDTLQSYLKFSTGMAATLGVFTRAWQGIPSSRELAWGKAAAKKPEGDRSADEIAFLAGREGYHATIGESQDMHMGEVSAAVARTDSAICNLFEDRAAGEVAASEVAASEVGERLDPEQRRAKRIVAIAGSVTNAIVGVTATYAADRNAGFAEANGTYYASVGIKLIADYLRPGVAPHDLLRSIQNLLATPTTNLPIAAGNFVALALYKDGLFDLTTRDNSTVSYPLRTVANNPKIHLGNGGLNFAFALMYTTLLSALPVARLLNDHTLQWVTQPVDMDEGSVRRINPATGAEISSLLRAAESSHLQPTALRGGNVAEPMQRTPLATAGPSGTEEWIEMGRPMPTVAPAATPQKADTDKAPQPVASQRRRDSQPGTADLQRRLSGGSAQQPQTGDGPVPTRRPGRPTGVGAVERTTTGSRSRSHSH